MILILNYMWLTCWILLSSGIRARIEVLYIFDPIFRVQQVFTILSNCTWWTNFGEILLWLMFFDDNFDSYNEVVSFWIKFSSLSHQIWIEMMKLWFLKFSKLSYCLSWFVQFVDVLVHMMLKDWSKLCSEWITSIRFARFIEIMDFNIF